MDNSENNTTFLYEDDFTWEEEPKPSLLKRAKTGIAKELKGLGFIFKTAFSSKSIPSHSIISPRVYFSELAMDAGRVIYSACSFAINALLLPIYVFLRIRIWLQETKRKTK